MSSKRKILFICTGNICRSVLAEKLLNAEAARKRLPIEARSCGVAAQKHYQVPGQILRLLEKRGLRETAHTPRLIDKELLAWSDVALTMTESQRRYVRREFPEFKNKVFLLRGYVALPEPEIEDPMGLDEQAFLDAEAAISEALVRLSAC